MTTTGYYVQHTFLHACAHGISFFPPFLGRVATLIVLTTKRTHLWFSQWRMCDPEFKNLIYILIYELWVHRANSSVAPKVTKCKLFGKEEKSFKWCDNLKLHFFSPVAKLIKT